ncbi:MAG: polysaccharide deacetylase family protein [Actinomycetota bacterium]
MPAPRRATVIGGVMLLVTACAPGQPATQITSGTVAAPTIEPSTIQSSTSAPATTAPVTTELVTTTTEPPMTCAPGSAVTTVPTGGLKLVAFSFDDGPSPTNTQAIMTEFEQRGVRATFFEIGPYVERYADVSRDVVRRGFEIGNHTMTHQYLEDPILSEIGPTADLIQRVTGVRPRLFRAPGLASSRLLQDGLAKLGMCNILASILTGDASQVRPQADTICQRFKDQLRPGGIVLAHDGGVAHESTVQAVPCMLDYALAQGYQVLTISRLLARSTVNGFS